MFWISLESHKFLMADTQFHFLSWELHCVYLFTHEHRKLTYIVYVVWERLCRGVLPGYVRDSNTKLWSPSLAFTFREARAVTQAETRQATSFARKDCGLTGPFWLTEFSQHAWDSCLVCCMGITILWVHRGTIQARLLGKVVGNPPPPAFWKIQLFGKFWKIMHQDNHSFVLGICQG